MVDTVSKDNKLNQDLSTYHSGAPCKKITASLVPTKKNLITNIDNQEAVRQDNLQILPKGMIADGNPQPIPSTVKPIAGFVQNNPKNSDAEMLGESINLTYSSTPQGIKLLLPPIQKAPENKYGESVIGTFTTKWSITY
jgi:hypothetical protein